MLLRDKIAYFAQSLHSKSNNFAFCHTESIPHGRGGQPLLMIMDDNGGVPVSADIARIQPVLY